MKKIILVLLLIASFNTAYGDVGFGGKNVGGTEYENESIINDGEGTTTTKIGDSSDSNATKNLGSSSIKDSLLGITDDNILNDDADNADGLNSLSGIFVWFKSELFSILSIISIGVFIFIGAKLLTARGNPEEFKKAMLHFVYSVIGIFVVFMSWGLVKLVSTLSL